MKNEENKIEFKYIFEDDYNPKYANGAYGGIAPLGEIVLNFYVDRQPVPYSETREISEGGEIGELIEIKPHDHKQKIVRYIQSGVILNLDSAKRIHKWLGEQVDKLEKDRGK